ncbi:13346_t:CDS:2, partial [Funneliformis geosporum]
YDRTTVAFSQSINRIDQKAIDTNELIDEIKILAVYLSNHQTVTFSEEDNLYDIINNETRYKTTLTAWFQENMNNTEAQNYKYTDFPIYYTWNAKLH